MAQDELVVEVVRELDLEMQPLRTLLDGQSSALERVMANLAQQLETVRAFASSEEANLRALQGRMQDESMGFVAHAFAEVVEEQQQRTEAVRERIERQREPFERFAADERETVELALKRFDGDVAALERALAEERKIAQRLLEAMRSDEFKDALRFLTDRQQAIEEAAVAGTTDPSHIAEKLQRVRTGRESGRAGVAAARGAARGHGRGRRAAAVVRQRQLNAHPHFPERRARFGPRMQGPSRLRVLGLRLGRRPDLGAVALRDRCSRR